MRTPATSTPAIVRFGLFELDLQSLELRHKGTKIRLEGQPLKVLSLLLVRPGKLVTRAELQEKLWPADMIVDFEHGINVAVERLREALNDSATDPRFIETLPRRGYRFIYPIQSNADVQPALTDNEHGSPRQSGAQRPEIPTEDTPVITIGAVARHFGISVDLLRLYEREGLLIPLRSGTSRRHFTEHDLPWIGELLHLVRDVGLNFAGIRRLLALLPCWQMRNCEYHNKQGCPYIKNAVEPCWTNRSGCCSSGEQSCYFCPVYRSAARCENLKELLASNL